MLVPRSERIGCIANCPKRMKIFVVYFDGFLIAWTYIIGCILGKCKLRRICSASAFMHKDA